MKAKTTLILMLLGLINITEAHPPLPEGVSYKKEEWHYFGYSVFKISSGYMAVFADENKKPVFFNLQPIPHEDLPLYIPLYGTNVHIAYIDGYFSWYYETEHGGYAVKKGNFFVPWALSYYDVKCPSHSSMSEFIAWQKRLPSTRLSILVNKGDFHGSTRSSTSQGRGRRYLRTDEQKNKDVQLWQDTKWILRQGEKVFL